MAVTPVTIESSAANGKVFQPTAFNNDMNAIATAINALIALLESVAPGTSGSDYVQCRPITGINGGVGASLNTILTALKTYIDTQDSGITQGAVPDGSIGPEKLSFDPATQAELEAAIAGVQVNVTGAASTVVSDNLTASKVLVSDASGKIAVATLAASILGYLANLTGDVQAQLNAKQGVISGVSDAEIGFLDGVTSSIQSQLNGKLASSGTAVNSDKVDGYHIWVSASAPPDASYIWIQV